jgi:hypothetical protein
LAIALDESCQIAHRLFWPTCRSRDYHNAVHPHAQHRQNVLPAVTKTPAVSLNFPHLTLQPAWRPTCVATQDQFFHPLGTPCFDPALLRSQLGLTCIRFRKHPGRPIHQYIDRHKEVCKQPPSISGHASAIGFVSTSALTWVAFGALDVLHLPSTPKRGSRGRRQHLILPLRLLQRAYRGSRSRSISAGPFASLAGCHPR